jgi:hypothetical protein
MGKFDYQHLILKHFNENMSRILIQNPSTFFHFHHWCFSNQSDLKIFFGKNRIKLCKFDIIKELSKNPLKDFDFRQKSMGDLLFPSLKLHNRYYHSVHPPAMSHGITFSCLTSVTKACSTFSMRSMLHSHRVCTTKLQF